MSKGILIFTLILIANLGWTQGTALELDGSNEFIDATSTSSGLPQGTSPRTVEAWVRTTQTSIGNIVSWGTRTTQQRNSLAIRDRSVAFIGENADVTGIADIDDGNWHHVAFTYDGTAIRLYVDGALDRTVNISFNTNGQNLKIGNNANPSNGEYFDGTIDEIRIWNIALDDTQIADLAGDSFTDPTTPSNCLVAYYKMNEGSGSSLTDLTGNGNTGTLTNMESGGWVTSTAGVTDQSAPTCSSLPVELVYFRAAPTFDNIKLEWLTSAEINNNGFNIEHSVDGIKWQMLGFINGVGNSISQNNYSFIHDFPENGINYYRLNQIDFDGRSTFSNAISVYHNIDSNSISEFFPNPSKKGIVNLNFVSQNNGIIHISVFDVTGKFLLSQSRQISSGVNNLEFNLSNLSKGIFMIRIKDKIRITHRKLIIGE